MTYSLPFGLTQKPMNHYFEHGVIKFSCREGKLFYAARLISKSINGGLSSGIVKSKAHLDKLLSIKTINELQTIEVVN